MGKLKTWDEPRLRESLHKYGTTKNNYWLADAATVCLKSNVQLPEEVREYLIDLLSDVMGDGVKKLKAKKSKAETSSRKGEWIWKMGALILLTETDYRNAAYRINKQHEILGLESPTRGVLENYWTNRFKIISRDMTIEDLIQVNFWGMTHAIAVTDNELLCSRECSDDGKSTITVKDLFPPDPDGSRTKRILKGRKEFEYYFAL